VRTLLEHLNLTTAARRLADLLAQAETTQPAYSAFLQQILEVEDGARWERKLERRRRWSKLGPPVCRDGFDWAARPQLSPQVVKELLTCRFVEELRRLREVDQLRSPGVTQARNRRKDRGTGAQSGTAGRPPPILTRSGPLPGGRGARLVAGRLQIFVAICLILPSCAAASS
jgi:hypothetical protein